MLKKCRQVRFDHRIQRRLFRTVTAVDLVVGDAYSGQRRAGARRDLCADRTQLRLRGKVA
jgi:hypothetical protein